MVEMRSRWELPLAMSGFGLVLGALAALAWRFATPTSKAANPANEPGFHGEIVLLDNKTIVTPAVPWMPETAIYLVAGTAMLLAFGMLMTGSGWRLRSSDGSRRPLLWWFAILGGLFGVAVAAIGVQNPPVQPSAYIRDGGGPGVTFDEPIRVNVGRILLTYPIIGICVGLILAAALAWGGWRLMRMQSRTTT